MIVYYRLDNSSNCDKVYLDGSHISLANLKEKIIQQNNLGENRNFDLKIINVRTKKEYVEDSCLIPNLASLKVTRVSLKCQNNCGPMHAQMTPPAPTPTASKRKNAVKQASAINPSKRRKMRGLAHNASGSTDNSCPVCSKMGGIENCPLNHYCSVSTRNQSKSHTEVKRNCTKKPNSFIDAGNSSATKEPTSLPSAEQKPKIPEHLICGICKNLIRNAVSIKCCNSSFCNECVSNALHESVGNECPVCHKKRSSSIGLLAPNFFLRNLVSSFKNETTTNKSCQPKESIPVIVEEAKPAQKSNHDDTLSNTDACQPKSTAVTAASIAPKEVAHPANEISPHDATDSEKHSNDSNKNGMETTSNQTQFHQPDNPTAGHSTVVSSTKSTNATEAKLEANFEPIVIDVDDDHDVLFVANLLSGPSVASNIIEVDTIDNNLSLQTLEKIANEYNESATTNTIVVRPWMADDCARKRSIHTITQFALYKCMMEKCSYATNSSKLFQQHMGAHDQVIDYFKNKYLLDEKTREKLSKFRECAYCSYKSEANGQLIEHVERMHLRSIFQCAFCFYRTIEVDNLLLHQKMYHPTSSEAILLCSQTREFQQKDDEILQNAEQNVLKILCDQGQDHCTREFACYKTLHAHLSAKHPGKYTCPYCDKTMTMDEHTIVDHLSNAHRGFEEFQCLLCVAGFSTVEAIREHMSVQHPSNYLFHGARRSSTIILDDSTDQIQLVYANVSQEKSAHALIKWSQSVALNAMNPMELIPSEQLKTLEKLDGDFQNMKTESHEPVPQILGATSCNIIKYNKYELLTPLNVQYKCITDETIADVNAIESYIDRSTDIDPTTQCHEFVIDEIAPMLRHRCQKHGTHPIVFLRIEQRGQIRVHKIVRCKFQCQRCHMIFHMRSTLTRHFNSKHPNHWIAAKILMETQIIESTKSPKSAPIQSVDYFYSSALACIQPNCKRMIGTRTQAIEHHNQHHRHPDTNNSNQFVFILGEKIVKNSAREIASYVREINEPHQMHLFECLHCFELFESFAKIQQHFTLAERCKKGDAEFMPRFSMKKLFRCPEDNVIRTYDGLKSHYKDKHPGKQCTPLNMLIPKQFCGLCDYNYKTNSDLDSHYGEKHAGCSGDFYSDKLFEKMELDEVEIEECKYSLECCTNQPQTQLQPIIDHLMKCERRFICRQCPKRKFSSMMSFILHCVAHNANADSAKIVENLQNIKIFLSLMQNVTILMPNGLVLKMAEIGNTTFGQKISVRITQIVQESWNREKDDLRPLTAFNEQLKPFENETLTGAVVSMDTVEQTTASETNSNVQKQNDSRTDSDTNFDDLYEPLFPNTDDIIQALEKAVNCTSSSESHQITLHDLHMTMDDSMVANNQHKNVKRSKSQANAACNNDSSTGHRDDKGVKPERVMRAENHSHNAKILESELTTNDNDDISQIHQEMEKLNGNAKETASNVAVESVHNGADSTGDKVQRDRKIHRPTMVIRKVSGVKRINKKQPPRRQKKPVKGEVQSFGSFLDTQLRKISDQEYRDQTERNILRLLLDRMENEPTNESTSNRSTSNGTMDASKHLVKRKKSPDEIQNVGKILSAKLRKITNQKLTQWQLLRFLVNHIENQSASE